MPQFGGKSFTQYKNVNILDELRIQGVKVSTAGAGTRSNYVLVKQKSDLPAPVGGIITLGNNFDYEINGIIDLGTDRIETNGDNVIIGLNETTDRFVTNNVQAIFTDFDGRSTFENLSFENASGEVFNVTDTGSDGSSFKISNCRIVNCGSVGTFNDCPSVTFEDIFIIGTPEGISFTGGGIIVSINNVIIAVSQAGTLIDLGNATFDAINISGNFLRSSVVTTFINALPDSANIAATGQGTLVNNVTIGETPTVNGISTGDLRWDLIGNNTLPDTVNQGSIFMANNAVATDIQTAGVGVDVKVAGTTTDTSLTQRFEQTDNNEITYNGRKSQNLNIVYNISGIRTSGSGTRLYTFSIYKNGVPLPNASASIDVDNRTRTTSIIGTTSVVTGDFFELFVQNEDNNNDITVTDLTGIIG